MVIAGGKAKRMGLDIPKCLLQVRGKTLVDKCIESLTKEGFRQFVFLVGHQHQLVMEHIGDGAKYGIEARYSIDPVTSVGWGKGKAINYALRNSSIDRSRRSLVLFPDDIILENDIYSRFMTAHLDGMRSRGCLASIVLVPGTEYPYGVAEVDVSGLILDFKEKPLISKPTSIGIYLFEPQVYEVIERTIDLQAPDAIELESVALPFLARERRLEGFFIDSNTWLPVNTVKEYERLLKVLTR